MIHAKNFIIVATDRDAKVVTYEQ